MIAENSTPAAPEGARTVTASSNIQGESSKSSEDQRTSQNTVAGGLDEQLSHPHEATSRSIADEALASNDGGNQNHLEAKRTINASAGCEVARDVSAAAPSSSTPISGGGEPAVENNITSVKGAEHTSTGANANATNESANATKQEAGRRGSEFLLIAAQAAEAAEFAEKAQSRADAIRKAAIQLTSPSTQDQQNHDSAHAMNQLHSLAGGMVNLQGLNSTSVQSDPSSSIEIDEKLKAQVYSVAATMMQDGMMQDSGRQSKYTPMPSLTVNDGALHRPKPPKSSASDKPRPTPVKHVYHDYASAPTPSDMPRKKTGGVSQPFPDKLMNMLDRETATHPDVVTWCPHGRAFVVKKPKVFTAEVMINYFRQSKLTSFQRQLNLYGFRRLTQGLDAGAYYHELFLRGRPDLTSKMVRQKVKGTGHKQPTDASTEPNFYAMPPVTQMTGTTDATLGFAQPHSAPTDFSQPPPMAVPDGTLYTNSSKKPPMPSPSLQAVATLRRLSNPGISVPNIFSLGAPAAEIPPQQANIYNTTLSGRQQDAFPYQMQPLDPSTLSPSKVHGFQPTSALGSCPVASEAAVTMTQMFSAPSPAEGGENGNDSMGIQSYAV